MNCKHLISITEAMHWADYSEIEKQDIVDPLIPDWKGPHSPPVITWLNRSLELNELCRAYNFSDYPKILKTRSLAVGDQEAILRRKPAVYITYKYPEQGPRIGKTL